jgi:hypothetical protein
VLSLGKKFPYRGTTEAGLTGARGVHLYQSAPGAFSLVRNLGEKGSPSDILHGLREPSPYQTFYVEVFDGDRSEISNQFEGQLVLELIS